MAVVYRVRNVKSGMALRAVCFESTGNASKNVINMMWCGAGDGTEWTDKARAALVAKTYIMLSGDHDVEIEEREGERV